MRKLDPTQDVKPAAAALTALGEGLARLLAQARAARPGVCVPDEVLIPYVRRRADPQLPLLEALGRLHLSDLLLTCAAGQGDPPALAQLEALCAAAALRNPVDRGEAFCDELRQTLLVDLVVGHVERGGRLAQYSGRGRLEGWLSALALTGAHNLRRRQHPGAQPVELSDALEVLIDFQSPELLKLREQARDGLKRAVQQAVRTLDAREQNVLRLRCVEGATAAAIAVFYGVTVASVARWLAAIREKLLRRTRKALAEDAGEQVDSLVRTLQGELSVSLERFLDDGAR